MIEILVVITIMSLAIAGGAVALGALSGADVRRAASDLATGIRYTYNLAAINNRDYALYLDLDAGTWHAAPLPATKPCDRVLLDLEGGEGDPVVTRYMDAGDSESDDDEKPGPFDAALTPGTESKGPPSWSSDAGTPAGKLRNMLSQEVKDTQRREAENRGLPTDEGEPDGKKKRMKSFRKNLIGKPQKLPKGVKLSGVVVRDGAEPVTEGTVPIIFYAHGVTQRALIYVADETDDEGDIFTIEVMSLQGMGRIHSTELPSSEFNEVEP
jgi:type II secretory pathway pseudopilin PulG